MFAAPQSVPPAHAGGVSELVHVVVALLLVLAVVFVLATVVRRARGFSARGSQLLEVLADVPLGTKERAVLLRVGSAQLLLGVAPGRVNALHVLPEPLDVAPPQPGAPRAAGLSFQALLRRSLGA
ncbi:MAG TPA: flagellar biosynthetic protein FliO [Steroidobacteraceae bacterium]|nr:flagellar biosynthetic protein FliO [Steroidobacteraceae bacterium]